jgi:hypothetical protein
MLSWKTPDKSGQFKVKVVDFKFLSRIEQGVVPDAIFTFQSLCSRKDNRIAVEIADYKLDLSTKEARDIWLLNSKEFQEVFS